MTDISIIVPTYKPGEYLIECLESLRNQKCDTFSFEVLIILNGSDKKHEILINDYIKKYGAKIFKFYSIESKGVSHARNFGIEKSSGKYLFFLDDDDLLESSYFKFAYPHVEEETLVCGDMKNFEFDFQDSESSYMSKIFPENEKNSIGTILDFKRIFSICTGRLIPKKSISNVLFDTNVAIGEDSLFMSTISYKLKKVVLCREAIYFRRLRSGSAMSQKKSFRYQLNNTIYLIKKHCCLIITKPRSYNLKFILFRILAILKGFFFRAVLI